MHAVEKRYDTSGSTDSDEFTETFRNLKVSSECLHAVSRQGEAFTTIEVQCSQKRSNQFLRLKIDTGAQGSALPVRTFRQMYGDIELKKILTPIVVSGPTPNKALFKELVAPPLGTLV